MKTSIMLMKLDSIKNKKVKRFLEHILYLAIVIILIPTFFYFELFVVLPALTEQWAFWYLIHLFCATFLLYSIISNMIYGMFTNTSINRVMLVSCNQSNWTMCLECECMQPPRAWHCNICNTCILKRDHHCTFFACCIGYYNLRHFILFTMYIFVSMLYALYFNIKFLALFVTWNHGLVLVKFLFPLASFVYDTGNESLYVFLVVINVIVGIFTGFLFFYHLNNILRGKVVPETKDSAINLSYDKGWKLNLIEVLGDKWYLTWISPSIYSPLPGNGISWEIDHKYK